MLSQESPSSFIKNGLNIVCIGAGYVGGPTMAVIAFKCRQHRVTVCDFDGKRIAQWQKGCDELPIYEPGLQEVVQEATRQGNLFFTTEMERVLPTADVIFLAVNTPTKTRGKGSGAAADLTWLEAAMHQVCQSGRRLKPTAIIVEKSTVPVGTAAFLASILKESGQPSTIRILNNPEFLAEGTAIQDLLHPDRILIGGGSPHGTEGNGELDEYGARAVQTLASIYAQWVSQDRILCTDVWSSELAKLVKTSRPSYDCNKSNFRVDFCVFVEMFV